MKDEINAKYSEFYKTRNSLHVYPVEFVVRAYLGTYPDLRLSKTEFAGKTILDLGFGDGRNMPLLANLGMQVSGVEISDEICNQTKERMRKYGIDVDTRVGRNNGIPFPNATFDHLLACHSCYYIDKDTSFNDNLKEIARVLKPSGIFVFSVPIDTSYIFKNAKDLGRGHMQIAADPYGVRNGYVLKAFSNKEEIIESIAPYFDQAKVGACRNNFWGIDEHVWTVVCTRTTDLSQIIGAERASQAYLQP